MFFTAVSHHRDARANWKNSHWTHIHDDINNQNSILHFTVDDFKLTCTITNVKRGTDVPLLSERVHQGNCFRRDKRFFVKMACPLKARRWIAEHWNTTDTLWTIPPMKPAAHVHSFFKLVICLSNPVYIVFLYNRYPTFNNTVCSAVQFVLLPQGRAIRFLPEQ